MTPERETLLIQALDELEAGRRPEEILARYPEHAEALAPALRMAAALRDRQIVPAPSLRSAARRDFLEQAAEILPAQDALASSQRSRPSWPWNRLGAWSTGLAATVLVFLLLGTSTVFAASRALPGEPLYPIKRSLERARLSAAPTEGLRQAAIDAMTRARIDEVERLLAEPGREAEVYFSGPVEDFGEERWRVGGIELSMRPATLVVGTAEIGEWVHVRGVVREGRLLADAILYDSQVPFEPSVDPWPTLQAIPSRPPATPAPDGRPTATRDRPSGDEEASPAGTSPIIPSTSGPSSAATLEPSAPSSGAAPGALAPSDPDEEEDDDRGDDDGRDDRGDDGSDDDDDDSDSDDGTDGDDSGSGGDDEDDDDRSDDDRGDDRGDDDDDG